MKLTAKVKLQTNQGQSQALLETMGKANAACNWISDVAWDKRTFNKYGLQEITYHEVKGRFDLTAQVVVRCISKVADAYKLDKKTGRTFNPHGAIAYDARILRWYVAKQQVSIWTVAGRLRVPFVAGKRQLELLKHQRGESDLTLINGIFYLFATCEVETAEPVDVEGILGIDLGIVNIATTSDGETYAGNQVNNVRHRHRRLRTKLQKKQTKSAKRRLKKLSGKEARFGSDTNHVISKRIIATAQGTNRAIAVEQLKGISSRVTVRKPQRATLHSWSFHQLKGFISYKAQLKGVPLIEVDPRNTSRTCPACGCVDKRNRPNQSTFSCIVCGFSGLADYIASVIISRRAAVNRPNVSTAFAIDSSIMSMAAVRSGTNSPSLTGIS